jgi:hypothetical protein
LQGVAAPVRWLPDWEALGGSPWAVAATSAGVLPIIINADLCHQSIFPAMAILKPYSTRCSLVG